MCTRLLPTHRPTALTLTTTTKEKSMKKSMYITLTEQDLPQIPDGYVFKDAVLYQGKLDIFIEEDSK